MAKYELFQRLNTGGAIATPQEVRNCILVMYNKSMFNWLKDLSCSSSFKECTALSDRLVDEQYDLELVLRFIIFRKLQEKAIKNFGYVGKFLTEKMIEFAEDKSFDMDQEADAFNTTFEILNNQMGNDSFRRYSPEKDKFMGGFLLSAYEVIALGVGYKYAELSQSNINIRERVKQVYSHDIYKNWSGSGTTAERRIPKLLPLGRQIFKP